jgi:hypothetical protein
LIKYAEGYWKQLEGIGKRKMNVKDKEYSADQ